MAQAIEMSSYKKTDTDDIKIDIIHELNDTNNTKDKIESTTATWAQLFSTADTYDIILMSLGVIGAIITGISIPFFNVLFDTTLEITYSTKTDFLVMSSNNMNKLISLTSMSFMLSCFCLISS